jgi:hypothetical protein
LRGKWTRALISKVSRHLINSQSNFDKNNNTGLLGNLPLKQLATGSYHFKRNEVSLHIISCNDIQFDSKNCLQMPWKAAKAFCERKGLELAVFETKNEMQLVNGARPGGEIHPGKFLYYLVILFLKSSQIFLTGWAPPTFASIQDSSTGLMDSRWTLLGGAVDNPIALERDRKRASIYIEENCTTIRAPTLIIPSAKWGKSTLDVFEHCRSHRRLSLK